MGHQFIAVVPGQVQENTELKRLIGKIKRTFTERELQARWTHPDLWHITLQFLGELDPQRTGELHALIEQWSPDVSDLTLRLQGVGGFPSSDHAKVLWLGVQKNQQLLALQTQLHDRLHAQGFILEEQAYQPHMTLARLRNAHSLSDIVNLGGRKHFGDYPIAELVVFESVLQGGILRYLPRLVKMIGLGQNK